MSLKVSLSFHEIYKYYKTHPEGCFNSLHGSKACEKLQKCVQCHFATYCSADCQKKDWKFHKHVCMVLRPHESSVESLLSQKMAEIPASTLKNPMYDDSQVFVTTNEPGHDLVVNAISKRPPAGNCYIGVGVCSSLNLFAVRSLVDTAIILDPNRKNQEFLQALSQIVVASSNRKECIKMIKDHLEAFFLSRYSEPYFIQRGSAQIQYQRSLASLEMSHSFLFDEERYEKVKKAFKEGKIIVKLVDLSDDRFCSEVKSVMDELALKVDTLYLSNVLEFIHPSHLQGFKRTIDLFMNEDTLVVDTQEKPFNLIPIIGSLLYTFDFPLDRVIHSEGFALGQKPTASPSIERMRPREGRPIEHLFPLMNTASKLDEAKENPSKLYFQYGLDQSYYTQEQLEFVEKFSRTTILEISNQAKDKLMEKVLELEKVMHMGFLTYKSS